MLADSQPLASVLSFYHNGAVMPFWGGGSVAARGARANERMYYELMLHARRRGMTRCDFGRSKTGTGPFAFKKNWGLKSTMFFKKVLLETTSLMWFWKKKASRPSC